MEKGLKVKEMIELLKGFNQEAEVIFIDEYHIGQNVTFYGFGGGDGCNKENCNSVSFTSVKYDSNNEF